MSLPRSFWRAVAGASGLGLLVPAALLLVAVTATVTGAGGLGAGLRQVFDGPEVPSTAPGLTAVAGRAAAEPPAILEIPRRARAIGPAAVDADAPGAARPRPSGDAGQPSPRRSAPRTPPAVRPPTPPARPPGRTPAPASPPAPAPAAVPAPETAPSAPPETNPIRRLVRGVNDGVVRPLPLVGEPAADAVQTVVDLIIPPPLAPRLLP